MPVPVYVESPRFPDAPNRYDPAQETQFRRMLQQTLEQIVRALASMDGGRP